MKTSIPVLSVQNVCKSFKMGGEKIRVVDDVSFEVQPGEILGLLGPNGAGKTTMMKIASGLIIPDSGQVLVSGCDPHKSPKILRRVGTVLEGNRNLFWRLTAAENLRYFAALKGINFFRCKKRINEVLERVELLHKKDVQMRKLSRGMQQRLAIAKCWLHKPYLVILDEPALGLDVHSRDLLLNLIKELAREGAAVLMTTHNMPIAQQLADRVIIINRGEVIKTARTCKLFEEFSGKEYVITLEGNLSDDQITILTEKFKAIVRKNTITMKKTSGSLLDALTLIKPVKAVSVWQKHAHLSQIFLELTGGNNG